MSATWDSKGIKATPVSADEILLIDTADSRNQKRATLSSLPTSSSAEAGITASTTQTQGQQPLTEEINQISTVANDNDVVTLPSATPFVSVKTFNQGANVLQIFPASGDDLGNGTNVSTTLGVNEGVEFISLLNNIWTIEILTAITPTYITAIDTSTQTFSATDTAQVITVDTIIESNKITSPSSGVFEFTEDGVYKLVMFPILQKTINQRVTHFLWLQLDTGSGFVDIADTNSETDLTGASGDIRTLTFVELLSFNAGDKIRFMNSTDDTDLTLVTKTPSAGNGPRVPAVIMSINKINGVSS